MSDRLAPGPAPDDDGTESFDPVAAAALIDSQRSTVRAAMDVRLHEHLLAWGVAWLVGFGAMWWQVRGQQPYTGPGGIPAVGFAVLLSVALAVTARRTALATAGITGESRWRGNLYGTAWAASYLLVFGLVAALARADAPPRAVGIVAVAGSIGVAGLMYLVDSALWGSRPMAVLGGWLLVVAVGGAFTGPVTALLLGAVLGGGALLGTGLWLLARRGR